MLDFEGDRYGWFFELFGRRRMEWLDSEAAIFEDGRAGTKNCENPSANFWRASEVWTLSVLATMEGCASALGGNSGMVSDKFWLSKRTAVARSESIESVGGSEFRSGTKLKLADKNILCQ